MPMNDDPFVYDENGLPSAMRTTVSPPELTPEELCDPVILNILELTQLPAEERRASLSENVSSWLEDDVGKTQIVRRLSAAGLSSREAMKFVEAVEAERSIEVVEKLHKRYVQGLALACIGTLMAVCTLNFFHFRFEGAAIVGYMILFAIPGGLFMAWHARVELKQVLKK